REPQRELRGRCIRPLRERDAGAARRPASIPLEADVDAETERTEADLAPHADLHADAGTRGVPFRARAVARGAEGREAPRARLVGPHLPVHEAEPQARLRAHAPGP